MENPAEIAKIVFSKLSSISFAGNPMENAGTSLKIEILLALEQLDLKVINKEEVVEENLEEAKETKKERIKKAAEVGL